MNTLRLLPQIAVALSALAAAAGLFLRPAAFDAALPWVPASSAARRALGAAFLAAGALMITSTAQPFFAFFAAALFALLLVTALVLLAVRRARSGWALTGGALLVSLAAGALEPLGLRVLALPKADALPYEPVAAARVLKTYPAGTRLESVRVASDGTIFTTANRGEDSITGDKAHVVAQVLARSPSGDERVLFELPAATTAGVLAIAPGGALYLTSDGAVRGVWRIARDGTGTILARLPEGSWPNGICVGPDGKLYVADARRGAIWRVDPVTGSANIAREDAPMKARPFVALAPATNGLHFVGRDLVVTVSDRAQVLKLHLSDDGQLGAPTVVAAGIPGDDFAVDAAGALYVTTHPYNTLVRIGEGGLRAIIADARQGVIGATDAAFGDAQTIYLVTDGGAFSSGDPRAAGTLVALTLATPAAER